jgi:hypothetical protein
MARTTSSPLPERLQYLEPVRKQLAALPPEAVLEDTNLAPLRKAVRKRIKGLSDTEIPAALQQDTAELEQWLSTSGPDHALLHFILPILPDAMEILFAEADTSPPERGEAHMELPPDAKVTKEHGCWSVKWKKRLLVLYPQHHEDIVRHTAQFEDNRRLLTQQDGGTATVEPVHFAPVTGHKSLSVCTRGDLTFKSVSYTFTVPGGHLLVTLQSTSIKNGHFDEADVEALFHTLKVLNYSPTKS